MTKLAFRVGLAALLATSLGHAAEASDGEGSRDDAKSAEHDTAAAPHGDPDKEVGEDATFGHGFQFGLRAGIAFGYQMMFRYDRSPLCNKYDTSKSRSDQQSVCGFGAPLATEVAVSFAPLDSIEPYLFGRFGFSGQSHTNTQPLQLFGVGARIYTMSDSRFKVFIEPAIAYETEGGGGNSAWDINGPGSGVKADYKKDLVFHAGVGPQYDVAKAFGIFLNAGVDVGVLRAISANLLVNIGVQARFP